MKGDYRINWQMPAEPIGKRVEPKAPQPIAPIRAFETMKDEEPKRPSFMQIAADAIRRSSNRGRAIREGLNRETPELPDFVLFNENTGRYEAKCCMCGEWGEMLYDISEVGEEHYCGGSYRCIP